MSEDCPSNREPLDEQEADVPVILNADMSEPVIQGVGVLRYPTGHGALTVELARQADKLCRDTARLLADSIRQGTIIALPNTKDKDGDFLWDFRIEGGDPGQVKVMRGKE